jgi:hypothetical protein
MDPGGVRFAGGISSGLHLEEVSYHELRKDEVQYGGEPDRNRPYQRPRGLLPPDLFNLMYLSALCFQVGVGIGHDLELNSSVSAALSAASGRIGLKYQFLNQDGFFYAALNPTLLFAVSEGGSSPEDEVTDGQQNFLQYILNDKAVFGVELPILMTWRTRNVAYNLSPSLAYYAVNISKAANANLAGNHMTVAGGLSVGTYFRLGKIALGPELSLVALSLFEKDKILNMNYSIGIISDF